MFSVFVIASSRGEILIRKDYREDVTPEQVDNFVSLISGSKQGSLPPCIEHGSLYGYYIRRDKLIYILISRKETSNFIALNFLESFYSVLRNFCGVVTNDSLQKNIALVHELMCESLENGYIQTTSTEVLRSLVYSDPLPTKPDVRKPGLFGLERVSSPAASADGPLVRSRSHQDFQHHEVFVDVVEKLTVHFTEQGLITRFHLNGSIHMKSFISQTHSVYVFLDEGVHLSKSGNEAYGSQLQLDDCYFPDCVSAVDFEKKRCFVVSPRGEISVMQYQLSSTVPPRLPFHLVSTLEESETSRDCNLILKLSCNIPGNTKAWNIVVHIPVPSVTRNVMQQFSISDCSAEYINKDRKVLWKIKCLPGNSEVIAKFKLVDALHCHANKIEIGPVAVEFEASNFLCSGLAIKHIKAEDSAKNSIHIQNQASQGFLLPFIEDVAHVPLKDVLSAIRLGEFPLA